MKVWFDLCEPKAPVYLKPLYDRVSKDNQVLITARDFDATYDLLDDWEVEYYKVGSHGGKTLRKKLHSYIQRLDDLLEIVEKERPKVLFSMAAPEAIRIAYGIGIFSVMFYDEPRSVGCSKLTLPMVDKAIVSKYIPFEWFSKYGMTRDRLVQFNGIDEVGWLNLENFTPDNKYLRDYGLKEHQFVICRPEATQSYSHNEDWPESQHSLLGEVIPELLSFLKFNFTAVKLLLLARYEEQERYFAEKFKDAINAGTLVLRRSVHHLAHIMYYSSLVLSGGGTMVRESSLLGVPSVEFIPSETYPQEKFLIENGFPLVHVKTKESVYAECVRFLENPSANREEIRKKIDQFENPIDIGYDIFKRKKQELR